MRKLALAAVAAFLCSASAFGADGSSGCGPGWYVFKENSLLSSSLRSTTNSLLFPSYTIGMTIGTSNCAKHSIVEKDQDSLHFAAKSMDLLRHDIARGSGQHLTAFIASFECQPLVQKDLSSALHKAFQEGLSQSQDPSEFVNSTRVLIDASGDARLLCS